MIVYLQEDLATSLIPPIENNFPGKIDFEAYVEAWVAINAYMGMPVDPNHSS